MAFCLPPTHTLRHILFGILYVLVCLICYLRSLVQSYYRSRYLINIHCIPLGLCLF